jgi:hypothetical protein
MEDVATALLIIAVVFLILAGCIIYAARRISRTQAAMSEQAFAMLSMLSQQAFSLMEPWSKKNAKQLNLLELKDTYRGFIAKEAREKLEAAGIEPEFISYEKILSEIAEDLRDLK